MIDSPAPGQMHAVTELRPARSSPPGIAFEFVGRDYNLVRGGIELHTKLLLEELRGRGHACSLTSPADWSLRSDSADVVVLEGVNRESLFRNGLLERWAPSRAVVCLFTHGSFYEFIHEKELLESGFRSKRLIRQVKRRLDDVFLNRSLDIVDFILAMSSSEREDLASALPRHESKIRVSPNFCTRPTGGHAGARPAFAVDRPILSFVGRIEDRKNLRAAVEASAGQPWIFMFGGTDRGALEPLMKYASARGIDNVRFLGPISESTKGELLSASSAVVIPSFFEGVPLLALESLSAGTPVVCTSNSYIGSTPGLFLCPPDPLSIRRAVHQAMSFHSTIATLPQARGVAADLLEIVHPRSRLDS